MIYAHFFVGASTKRRILGKPTILKVDFRWLIKLAKAGWL